MLPTLTELELFIILFWWRLYHNCCGAKSVQTQLVKDILQGYDTKVKPTFYHSKAINITFRPDLYLLVDVNEPRQAITLSMWISEQWKDDLLYWNPKKYNGITRITLPHDSLWIPDTVLYNSLVMDEKETRRLLNIQIDTVAERNTTVVKFNYPTMLTFSCHLNVQYFPFDTQKCTLVFGSWTYDNSGIDYHYSSKEVSVSNYLQNDGWDLISFTAERVVSMYDCCPEQWTTINLHLVIKRKSLFYIVNLILPSIIISLISIIGLFTPSSSTGERTERVTLGITTLLAMSILLLMVSDQMPSTSSYVPIIGALFLCIIILISIATLMTTAIIQIHQKGLEGKQVPASLKRCGIWFSKLLHIQIPKHLIKKQRTSYLPEENCFPKKVQQPLVLTCNKPKCYLNAQNHDAENCVGPKMADVDKQVGKEEMGNEKELAAIEWEWLASIVEKASCVVCLLLLFVITTLVFAFGWLCY